MKSRSSLWNGTSTSGPAGGAHRNRRLSAHRRSPRSARARAMRGILVLAFVLGSLGGLAVASMSHAGGGHNYGRVAVSLPWMWG